CFVRSGDRSLPGSGRRRRAPRRSDFFPFAVARPFPKASFFGRYEKVSVVLQPEPSIAVSPCSHGGEQPVTTRASSESWFGLLRRQIGRRRARFGRSDDECSEGVPLSGELGRPRARREALSARRLADALRGGNPVRRRDVGGE